MRLFKTEAYGETRVLVLPDDVELKEKVWIGGTKLFLLEKEDLEDYLKAETEADEDEYELYLHEWLQANDREYRYWIDEYAIKRALIPNENQVLYDVWYGKQDPEDYVYDLIYTYWDGNNFKDIVVIENETGNAYEVTENYPELTKIGTFKSERDEEGKWRDYGTGIYFIYKDSNDKYYIIDRSFYNGSLDFIEPISLEELQERFNFLRFLEKNKQEA